LSPTNDGVCIKNLSSTATANQIHKYLFKYTPTLMNSHTTTAATTQCSYSCPVSLFFWSWSVWNAAPYTSAAAPQGFWGVAQTRDQNQSQEDLKLILFSTSLEKNNKATRMICLLLLASI